MRSQTIVEGMKERGENGKKQVTVILLEGSDNLVKLFTVFTVFL